MANAPDRHIKIAAIILDANSINKIVRHAKTERIIISDFIIFIIY